MATATRTKEIQVHLTLSESEARWLMATMQNPIEVNGFTDAEDSSCREELFEVLRKQLR